MMNKRGSLVLRDVVFMMMLVSAVFVLLGVFVSDMANSYGNTNMTNEWAGTGANTVANSTFYDTGFDLEDVAEDMSSESTGIWSLIEGAGNTLKGLGSALFMVLTAPNTIGNLLYVTMVDAGVTMGFANVIKFMVVSVLWIIIIFSIVSAFLRGGKL